MPAAFTPATVTSTAPLLVVFDADPATPVPAKSLSSYTPVTGDRVQVRLRTPLEPIVQGKP